MRMLPVTVDPSRSPAGGSTSPTRTWKVPVTGSARGRHFAHPALRRDLGIGGQRDGDLRVPRRGVLDLRRHVEDAVASARARDLHDHAPGGHDLARLGADLRHRPAGVGDEARIGHPVLREVDLRLRGLHRRLRALQVRRDLVEGRLRDEALREQLFLPVVVVALLDELRPSRGELRPHALGSAVLVRGIEAGDELSGLDDVADVDAPLDHSPVDAEGEVDLGLRLDRASQGHRITRGTHVHGDHPHGADFGRGRRLHALAGREQGKRCEREDGDRSGRFAASPSGGGRGHGSASYRKHPALSFVRCGSATGPLHAMNIDAMRTGGRCRLILLTRGECAQTLLDVFGPLLEPRDPGRTEV